MIWKLGVAKKGGGMLSGPLIGGIALIVIGLLLAFLAGNLSTEYDKSGAVVASILAVVAATIGTCLILDTRNVNAVGEGINSPQFRAGAVYEKLSEIKVDDDYLAILKDSKNNIAVYKSPKKLPDKFIASELNDAVPIGGLVELGVESKKKEEAESEK